MRVAGNIAAGESERCGRAEDAANGLSRMGYIIALIVLVIVVPLLFVLLSRRSAAGGSGIRHGVRSVTREMPSADGPTPGAPRSLNQPKPGSEERLPPA